MPHLTIEYSANLANSVEFTRLCGEIHEAMMDSGLFEAGAIRVRAIRCEDYSIGDRLAENAFVDMSLRMGAGRSEADKSRAGNMIFEAAAACLSERLGEPHFALSLEIREIDSRFSWKRNTMHSRLRNAE